MKFGENTEAEVERVAKEVVDCAYRVHRELGPGLLESVYETCLAYELESRGLRVKRQVALPVIYRGITLEAGLRLDLLVEECLIIEIKAAEKINPVYEAQCLTYLKLTGLRLCLLINFYVPLFKDGIRRIIR